MKIGEIAKMVDLNVETLRYYERLGLIESPLRTPTGYRKYDKNVIDRINFIQNSQQLGFSLTEIKTLIDLVNNKCLNTDIPQPLLVKVYNLDAKLNELVLCKDFIVKLVLKQ